MGNSGRCQCEKRDFARDVNGWFDLLEAHSPMALLVVDLDSLEITRVNDRLSDTVGVPAHELVGRSLAGPDVSDAHADALKLLRDVKSGAIEGYQIVQRVPRFGGGSTMMEFGARAVPDAHGAPRYLLVEGFPVLGVSGTPEMSVFLEALVDVLRHSQDVFLLVDADARIRVAAGPVEETLGFAPEALAVRALLTLVHDDDLEVVTRLLDRAASPAGTGRPDTFRMLTASGRWLSVRAHFVHFPEAPGVAVGLLSEAQPGVRPTGTDTLVERVRRLEADLARVAEISMAAGAPIAHSAHATQAAAYLERLSTRESEIVLGLLRGQRVTTIAKRLFVSPSTVRNHLSRIFRKLDVHSQAELLEILSPRSASYPATPPPDVADRELAPGPQGAERPRGATSVARA